MCIKQGLDFVCVLFYYERLVDNRIKLYHCCNCHSISDVRRIGRKTDISLLDSFGGASAMFGRAIIYLSVMAHGNP